MTAAEAIKTLKANYPDACYEQLREAVDVAIEALEAQDKVGDKIRLIDANKLRKDVLGLPDCYNGFSDAYDKARILDLVDEQPTVDANPVRHGQWVKMSDADGTYYVCSECRDELPRVVLSFNPQFDLFPELKCIDKTTYCPSCGAKMENANG